MPVPLPTQSSIYPASKILATDQAGKLRTAVTGILVFTNGCFDLLHPGHVDYLHRASLLGDILVVGLNSDASIRRLKGSSRPVNPQDDRALVLAGLASVAHVVIFDQDTPLELITALQPDVLVKGGDWPVESIVGREIVLARGGRVLSLDLVPGHSTTSILERIRAER